MHKQLFVRISLVLSTPPVLCVCVRLNHLVLTVLRDMNAGEIFNRILLLMYSRCLIFHSNFLSSQFLHILFI